MNQVMGEKIQKEKIEIPKLAFMLLFMVFWTQYTVLNFAVQFIKGLPVIGELASYVVPLITVCLIVLALPYMIRCIRWVDVLFYVGFVVVVLLSLLFFEENAEYIMKELWKILGLTLPVYFLGICYPHEEMKKPLYICSLLGVAIRAVYQVRFLNLGNEMDQSNMGVSYWCLPSVMYAIYWALENKKLRYWLLAVPGIVLTVMFGTRGPILVMLLFILIRILENVFSIKNVIMKVIAASACILAAYFLIATDVITVLAEGLSEVFEKIGVSTRILELFLEGEITSTSGRDSLAQVIINGINEKMLLGWGVMGDRVLTTTYVHNLPLELWCHFGVILGSVFLIGILYCPLVAVLGNPDRDRRYFALMLTIMVLTKLMLSNSYLLEPYLFLLLGFSVAEIRRRNGSVVRNAA